MLSRVLRGRGAAWLRLAAHAGASSGPGLGSSGSATSTLAVRALAGAASTASKASKASRAASTIAADAALPSNAAAAPAEPKRRKAAAGGAKRKAAAAAPQAAAGPREGSLLLVESPAKAKKIQEFLGDDFKVLASYGHVRDLPAKPGAVVPEQGFQMQWQLGEAATPRMAAIEAAAQRASRVLLATDPDREGEAISWHLLQELQARKAVDDSVLVERITFTEVTKRAVLEALQAPRPISEPLVDAYMARRALDYLFGFHLSPLLWRKVPGARSAGRVQSVALRLVCEREAAIEAFQRLQYYTVEAQLQLPGGGALEARLASVDGQPPPAPGYVDAGEAAEVARRVGAARFTVAEAASREGQRQPPTPFTTSTLQQEANKRLGLTAARTMSLAQSLYEAGHITYMRTDGASLAPAAVAALRGAIEAQYGPEYVPPQPRAFKARSKNAQEAHEAIRPTDPQMSAEQLAARGVDRSACKLYGMIRGRALACQMAPARITQVSADLASADGALRLRATASAIAFPGYLAAYFDPAAVSMAGAAEAQEAEAAEAGAESEGEEGEDDTGSSSRAVARREQQEAARAAAAASLAAIRQGQPVDVANAAASEHETRPPARYTEGSLVKALEEAGIGRPSTYAPTLALLQQRGYVRRDARALAAEPLGRVLSAFLAAYFPQYVDYGFTSGLEQQLDAVSGGEAEWKQVLGDFWTPFTGQVSEVGGVPVTQVIDRLNELVGDQLIGKNSRACPSCAAPLSLKFSSKHRGMPFVGCSTYPDCDYSRPIAASWLADYADASAAAVAEKLGLEAADLSDVMAATAAAGSDSIPADLLEAAEGKDVETLEALRQMGMKGFARFLGRCPDTDLPVFVRSGLYGPYVQRGMEGKAGFKRQPLPRPHNTKTANLELALAWLELPRELGINPVTGEAVVVAMGKFGPFIRCGAASRSLPKEYDALLITLPDSLQLLATKSRWTTSRSARKEAAAAAQAAGEAEDSARAPAELPGDLSEGMPGGDGEAEAEAAAPRRRGRPPKPKDKESPKAAASSSSGGGGGGGSAAEQAPRRELSGPSIVAEHRAARLELEAAADVEVELLNQAMTAAGSLEADAAAARVAATKAALQRLQEEHTRSTAWNLFMKNSTRDTAEQARLEGRGPGRPSMERIGGLWNSMPEQERAVWEQRAAELRLEQTLHAFELLPPDQGLGSLSLERRNELEKEVAFRTAEARIYSSTRATGRARNPLLKTPNAFNLFVSSNKAALKDVDHGDVFIHMSEMWRAAPQRERAKYIKAAAEERKKSQEGQQYVRRMQIEATAAALAAGAGVMEAARAGLEASSRTLVEMMQAQLEGRTYVYPETAKAIEKAAAAAAKPKGRRGRPPGKGNKPKEAEAAAAAAPASSNSSSDSDID